MGGIFMSLQESNMHHYFEQVKKKLITLLAASRFIGISYRHAKRRWKEYKKTGATCLISKKRGQASSRRISDERRSEIAGIISHNYADFKPKFANEKLAERHGIFLSSEIIRQIMIEHKIWFPCKKSCNVHQSRPRRLCRGELLLTDASDHLWFEDRGPKCHLYIIVDDATSEITTGHFEKEETTEGYFKLFGQHINEKGVPVSVYCDKRGTFKVNQGSKRGTTQFGRAMQELGVVLIFAHSPQAKGRVERAFKLLQDRLIKEMRLHNISTMEAGNKFLSKFFSDHKIQFAIEPASTFDAHKPLNNKKPLKYILCHKYQRDVTKNLEVNYENEIYQIQTDKMKRNLKNVQIDILITIDGKMRFEYEGEEVKFKKFSKMPYQPPVPVLIEDCHIKENRTRSERETVKKQKQSSRKFAEVVDFRGYFETDDTLTKSEKRAAEHRLEKRRNESREDNLEIVGENAFRGGSI